MILIKDKSHESSRNYQIYNLKWFIVEQAQESWFEVDMIKVILCASEHICSII